MTRGEREGGRSSVTRDFVEEGEDTASISDSHRGRSTRVPDFRVCPALLSR